jgi:hypothetical protein
MSDVITKDVEEWIDSLPRTVWGLRRRLRRKGIRGVVGSSSSCPIANLAKAELVDLIPGLSVNVTGEKIRVRNDVHSLRRPLPLSAQKFMKRFDDRREDEFRPIRYL